MEDLTIKIPAIRIKQREGDGKAIYIARIKAKQLCSRPTERFKIRIYKRKELPNKAGYEDTGYQREPAKNKVDSIKKYIVSETKNPLFPTAITVSSESELRFDEKANGVGELTINPTLYIIDGQHRFKAWVDLMQSDYKEFEDYEMPLVILSGFSELDEVVQFHVINSRQTKVKTDLAHRHYLKLSKDKSTERLIKEKDRWVVRANVIANQLNEELDGVWNGYMFNANESTDKKRRIPIGVSAFATSLKPLFQKGKLFENSENQSDSAKLLALFWKQISEIWPEPFNTPKDYVLMKTVGVYSMHLLLTKLLDETSDLKKAIELSKNKLITAKNDFDYTYDYWLTKKHLDQKRKQSGDYAAAYSSASGHNYIVTSLIYH